MQIERLKKGESIEPIQPDPKMLAISEEIMKQNLLVLEMNSRLVDWMSTPRWIVKTE